MKIAYMIINYNDYETTKKLIDNIKKYEILDKILVVDNCSTDDSYEKLSKIQKIDVIQTPSNKGYGSGINFGSKYLLDKFSDCYIIVSNPDIIIQSEKDIEKLLLSFDNDTSIVAPIINEHGKLNRGWKVPRPIDDIMANIIYFHKFFETRYKDSYYDAAIKEVEAVSGCFFIIKASDLKNVDFFDENVFLYYEENIIARKLQKINKKIKINTEVTIIHDHSVTIDKSINHIKKYKNLKKSQMYFEKKYNKANVLERLLLLVTNKITLFFEYIVYFIKR